MKLMKKQDITEEMRKKIEFEKRGVGLEDGEFYDGSCFRDNCGTVLKCHPSIFFSLFDTKNILYKKKNWNNL